MENIATKADNIDSLSAAEFNGVQQEHENSITTSGQTLSGANLFQQAETIARYSATGATFYQDSGVADAYVLLPLGSFIAPAVYLDGAEATFKIGNDSTGASTINYAGIGVKSLTLPDGAAISDEMVAGEYASVRFNDVDDRVELESVSQSGAPADILLQSPITTTISTIVVGASVALPLDNTIPQNTEGGEFITVTITPKSATSTLVIEFNGYFGNNSGILGVALFQDSIVDAIAAQVWVNFNNNVSAGSIRHVMTSGTTSSITFKLRAGTSVASSVKLNANNASIQFFGGVSTATLTVTEYA